MILSVSHHQKLCLHCFCKYALNNAYLHVYMTIIYKWTNANTRRMSPLTQFSFFDL